MAMSNRIAMKTTPPTIAAISSPVSGTPATSFRSFCVVLVASVTGSIDKAEVFVVKTNVDEGFDVQLFGVVARKYD